MYRLTYPTLQALLTSASPTLWSTVYPRRYEDLARWHSPKIPATFFAQATAQKTMQDTLTPGGPLPTGLQHQYAVALVNAQHAFPTFFVPTALVRALDHTSPPPTTRWADLHLPHEGATFIFEQGAIPHPDGGHLPFVVYARTRAGDVLTHPVLSRLGGELAVAEGGFIVCHAVHASDDADFTVYDASLSERLSPEIQDVELMPLRGASGLGLEEETTWGDPRTIVYASSSLNEAESTFNKWVTALVFKLLLFMLARPDERSSGARLRTVKPKHRGDAPREFWSPTVLGPHYCAARESTGTHASPRLHWRRGHFRQQPYGPRRSQVKTIWLEPVLVTPQS